MPPITAACLGLSRQLLLQSRLTAFPARFIDRWLAEPVLLQRIDRFVVIGVASAAIQVLLMKWLLEQGATTFVAATLALQLSVLANFLANRFITWRDRFDGLSWRVNMVWSVPLFVIYDILSVSVWIKAAGINLALYYLDAPLYATWAVFEIVGAAINFLLNDRLTFGLLARVIDRLQRRSALHTSPQL